jgi:hypothetical protein
MSTLQHSLAADAGRQCAFPHLVGKLPLTTPMSATWNEHGTGALGRVELWRGSIRFGLSVSAPFVWRCPNIAYAHTRRADQ